MSLWHQTASNVALGNHTLRGYRRGGYWMFRWHEDQIKAGDEIKRGWSKSICIGPCEGPGAFTEKEARRLAWENHLSRLDHNNRTPQSVLTVREFVDKKFLPDHVAYKKHGGKEYYGSQLPFVLDGVPDKKRSRGGKTRFKSGEEPPSVTRRHGIGGMRLRDVQREDVQRLVGTMLVRGYSVQSAKHVKTVVSAIYTHAGREGWFNGPNPAKFVNLPEMERATAHALSFPAGRGPPPAIAEIGPAHDVLGGDDQHERCGDLRAEVEENQSQRRADHHG